MLGSILCLITLGLPTAFSASEEEPTGKIWAVLVAGSSGYNNYRHQADICHAYQILHRHGVPDSQIIVMMYDDIAQHPENPGKGQIYNRPRGRNLYANVLKDYTGEEVNSTNFMNVLTGNSKAMKGIGSGKVLKSGPNDHVFVNFVDHGSYGLVLFPSTILYADELRSALLTMHKQQMYKKLVFYLDSSQSGSLFKHMLPNNISVFASTAANPKLNSFSCNWDDGLQTYLASAYSNAWMEDVDSRESHGNLKTETLEQQYRHVAAKISHTSLYGDVKIKDNHVVDFLGKGKSHRRTTYLLPKLYFFSLLEAKPCCSCKDKVASRHVALASLGKRIFLTKHVWQMVELRKKREKLLRERKMVDQVFKKVVQKVANGTMFQIRKLVQSHAPLTLDLMPCYRTLVDNFSKSCVNINKNTYTLSHLYKLANLCALQNLHVEDVVLQVYAEECTESYRALNGVE